MRHFTFKRGVVLCNYERCHEQADLGVVADEVPDPKSWSPSNTVFSQESWKALWDAKLPYGWIEINEDNPPYEYARKRSFCSYNHLRLWAQAEDRKATLELGKGYLERERGKIRERQAAG